MERRNPVAARFTWRHTICEHGDEIASATVISFQLDFEKDLLRYLLLAWRAVVSGRRCKRWQRSKRIQAGD